MNDTLTTTKIIVADGSSIPYALKPSDRADCCSVEAVFRVRISDDLPTLLFCGHHFTKHEFSLKEIAQEILDESSKLITNRLVGSSN